MQTQESCSRDQRMRRASDMAESGIDEHAGAAQDAPRPVGHVASARLSVTAVDFSWPHRSDCQAGPNSRPRRGSNQVRPAAGRCRAAGRAGGPGTSVPIVKQFTATCTSRMRRSVVGEERPEAQRIAKGGGAGPCTGRAAVFALAIALNGSRPTRWMRHARAGAAAVDRLLPRQRRQRISVGTPAPGMRHQQVGRRRHGHTLAG